MTEGSCEKALIDILLARGILVFTYSDLLYQQVFHARQISTKLLEMINQLPVSEKIAIVRIGDKLSDELDITEIDERVESNEKVCIKPEFEILHTIKEGLFDDYLKIKSKKKVSDFYREHNPHYKKSYTINEKYFNAMSNVELHLLLNEYDKKRKGAHNKNELTLSSFMRGF